MKMSTLTRVTTGKKITPRAVYKNNPPVALDVQYPCAWFKTSKSKPVLDLELVLATLDAARSALRKSITDNDINIDVCKAFLYHYGLTIKSKLDEDWISYGMEIGKKDQEISPMSLLHINIANKAREIPKSENATAEDDSWMAGYVLSVNRLIRTSISKYKNQMAKRVTTQLRAIKSSAPEMTDIVDIYASWTSDKGYNTIAASYDMFFHRFPHHPHANMRIGTIGTRFRDCSALMSYGYLSNLLGMAKLTDVMDWVFVEQIGTDIDRMMTSGDELVDQFSYFPYHVDMGLVMKSAYSASTNPHFFEWVHTIGTLMKSTRSMNAAHVCKARLTDITFNAACVAYAYSSNAIITNVCTETGAPLEIIEDDEGGDGPEQNPHDEVLKTRDPTLWCTMLRSMDGEVPLPVKNYIRKTVACIADPRSGTIAENLVNLAPTLY